MVSAQKFHIQKLLFVCLALLCCFPGVMAQTISFADPDATVHKDVYMYNHSGALISTFNTTSSGVTIPGEDIILVLKPQYSNPLDEPSTFLSNMIGWLETNALALIILAAMAGLFLKRW
jgi:hypothetical protein